MNVIDNLVLVLHLLANFRVIVQTMFKQLVLQGQLVPHAVYHILYLVFIACDGISNGDMLVFGNELGKQSDYTVPVG